MSKRIAAGAHLARRLSVVLLASATPFLGNPAHAQSTEVVVGEGWEAFVGVEYQGGDVTQPKKRRGVLVLSDSTIAFHHCREEKCFVWKGETPFQAPQLWVIPLKAIRQVATKSRPIGAMERMMSLGVVAAAAREDIVVIVYETATSAEAPIFRVGKNHAGTLDAKLRFRLRKAGVILDQTSQPPDHFS